MELNNYLDSFTHDDQIKEELIDFLAENNWFGYEPYFDGERILIDDSFAKIENKIAEFIKGHTITDDEKISNSMSSLKDAYPETFEIVSKFFSISNSYVDALNSENKNYIVHFLLNDLIDEITKLNDKEVKALIEDAMECLNYANCQILSLLFAYTKQNYKTFYVSDFFLDKEAMPNNDAYEVDEYCRILYHMFNADYIEDNDMYYKAASSKNYIDTWLFISLHFICDLRNTDLANLPNPELPYDPKTVLEMIKEDKFADEDALKVLYSVLYYLRFRSDKPDKTKKYNVANIKFFVPKSTEVHIGKLLAIAQSWYAISGSSGNLIKAVTNYKDINRNMGEEIGDLFLKSNFHTRKANKSYMQIIELLTDSVLGMNEDFHVKGYMLASIARSHKGSYGKFASTTIKYLQDQKMTGYSPEFVAKELFERGVLSYIPKMLLSILTDREIDKFDVHTQTKLIEELSLSPMEVESVVSMSNRAVKKSNELVKELAGSLDRESVLEIVHRIGNGEAVSKINGSYCLMSAIKMPCIRSGIRNCSVCEFDILTKETLFKMINETKRLKKAYKETQNTLERKKLKESALLIARKLDEMLTCYKDTYGEKDLAIITNIIKEFMNEEN
ncbi:MAG: hypothetical protein SPE36_01080 [Lactobacillus johnsonii]|nr:hypothetical protein [Lactobacillus johnsonii]